MNIREVETYELAHYFNNVLCALEDDRKKHVAIDAEEFKEVSKELQQRKMITFH